MAEAGIRRRGWRWLALTLAILFPVLGLTLAQGADRYGFRVVRDQVYTPAGWPQAQAGDLYLPDRRGPLPVVLVVHGGSWRSGARDSLDATRIARHLAGHGIAAFSVDYRLAPAWRYPAPLDDLQSAVAWLRENAARLDLDASAVGAWGYSAGGHLVAMLGTQANAGLRLRAVVVGGVPADLTRWPTSPVVRDFLGYNAAEDPVRVRKASPVSHVGPGTAPFLLYHGAWDRMVEPEQSRLFAAALAAGGVEAELHFLPGNGHLLAAAFPGAALDQGAAFLDARLRAQAAASVPHEHHAEHAH